MVWVIVYSSKLQIALINERVFLVPYQNLHQNADKYNFSLEHLSVYLYFKHL